MSEPRWTDAEFLSAVAETVVRRRVRSIDDLTKEWAPLYYIAATLAGEPDDDPAPWRNPAVRAIHRDVQRKARRVQKRGLIWTCLCGCRGDTGITEKGLSLLLPERVA